MDEYPWVTFLQVTRKKEQVKVGRQVYWLK